MNSVALITGSTPRIGFEVAHVLDTSDAGRSPTFAAWITWEIGRLDVLVNNAAILIDEGESILSTKAETFETTMRVNALGRAARDAGRRAIAQAQQGGAGRQRVLGKRRFSISTNATL